MAIGEKGGVDATWLGLFGTEGIASGKDATA
jgi:hypothetical protein